MVDVHPVGQIIYAGKWAENEHRRVVFDISEYVSQYPDALYVLLMQRPYDENAYPVPSEQIEISDGKLYWTLTSGDMAQKGRGKCEVIIQSGTVVAKDDVYSICIDEAIEYGSEPPEPWEGWVTQVAEDADRAETAADSAEESAERAEHAAEHFQLVAELISGTNYMISLETEELYNG